MSQKLPRPEIAEGTDVLVGGSFGTMLKLCRHCGALTHPESIEAHRTWHSNQNELLLSLAERVNDLVAENNP